LDDDSKTPVSVKAKLEAAHVYEVETPFGLGRFAPYRKERMAHQTRLRIFWPRVVAWSLLLFFTLWLGGASALFAFVKYKRGFTDVRFSHLVFLPWKLDDYRRSKGEFLLKRGLAAAEAQQWADALYALRAALPYAPGHEEARMIVTRVYLMAGRGDLAQAVLVEGLAHHRDQVDYLRTVLGFLFMQQADEVVVDLTRALEAQGSNNEIFRRILMTARGYGYFNRGRYAEAERVFAEAGLNDTAEARFVNARIAWERGRRDEAIARLRELNEQAGGDAEIHRTLVFFLKEAGRKAELRRIGLTAQLARPEAPQGYLDFIEGALASGDEGAAATAAGEFLERFSGEARALLQLAERGAAAGRPEMVRGVVERLPAEKVDDVAAATLLLAEASLNAGRPEEVGSLNPATEKWGEAASVTWEGLRGMALVQQERSGEAEPLLWRMLESRRVGAPALHSIAVRLQRAGRGDLAGRFLLRAVEVDPLHQPSLVSLVEDAESAGRLDEMGGLVVRLTTMRKPPEPLMERLKAEFASDRYLYVTGRIKVVEALEARLALSREG
jgi:tetratricopeptide (TPR) repeat protein